MLLLVLLFSFLSAAVVDYVGIEYHAAREKRRWKRGSLLAMLHEALTFATAYASVLFAVQGDTLAAALVGVAAIVGVGAANAWGLR